MNPRTHQIARWLGTVLASTVVVASVLAAVPGYAKVPHAPHRYNAKIEGLAGYSPQRKCSPWAKPGTVAFSKLLLRTYRNSRSLGIVRACNVGGTSEHKEGRAFDWGVSAYNARDRRSVNQLMRWLLKRDRFGHRFAMARRLGIQYMIWNRRIWGSYSASSGWRRYTGPNPHTDHVHFSLSWKGARKRTSFWVRPGRIGAPAPRPPAPEPAPNPGPRPAPKPSPAPKPAPRPQPSTKAIPEPRPPRTLPAGSTALVTETVTLPARTRAGVYTQGRLRKGHEYLIEASGTYKYGPRAEAVADAECSTAPGSDWTRNRAVRRGQESADHLDLYVDGHDLLAESDNGQECDTDSHTYRWVYRAERAGRVPLKVWDPTMYSDNVGRLRVRIIDTDVVHNRMAWKVPSDAAAGVTSPASLRRGVEYDVTVAGTWRDGGGMTSDAECSITQDDPVWTRDRSGDHDLLLDKEGVRFEPTRNTGDDCDATGHAYRYTFTPSETRPINLRVADFGWYADNAGVLAVKVAPHVEQAPEPQPEPQPSGTEVLRVEASGATPVRTRSYPAGTKLRVTVSGTYAYRGWVEADAECVNWRGGWSNEWGGSGDLTVNGASDKWWPKDGAGDCDGSHEYSRTVTLDRDGALSFLVDLNHPESTGTLTVTVEEIR